MNYSVVIPSTHPTYAYLHPSKWHHRRHQKPRNHRPTPPTTTTVTSAVRRHLRRRGRRHPEKPASTSPSPQPDQKLQVVIDIESLSSRAPASMKRLLTSTELRLNEFVISGGDAFRDLQTLVAVDSNQKIVVSCRRSTVDFLGNLVIGGLLLGFSVKVLGKAVLGLRDRLGFGYYGGGGGAAVVTRRDRSLGGKEVVVGTSKKALKGSRVFDNPLALPRGAVRGVSRAMPKNWTRKKEQKLPKWWPVSLPLPVLTDNKEYQITANRMVRAMMDYRMSGKDISKDDIIQLRHICRISGVRVSIDTSNARDSIYRASVDYILSICSRHGYLVHLNDLANCYLLLLSTMHSCLTISAFFFCSMMKQSAFAQIDGEDPLEFIAGLADNIGLESIRAARMVAAAVAARTRSWLLQAWALEMQGQHAQAVQELSKICRIHHAFPPGENSFVIILVPDNHRD
ncbi:hypothetical protein RJ639_010000 [Escallonia herrerae]|uniref:Uncharacterized protein n=1 Tax=Escallonia herrerae TaxID=1293975 RepID=A0AA88VT28_9ASTE|nr:hypothetical protein RJ639_010000 [Escallonia herrerae]